MLATPPILNDLDPPGRPDEHGVCYRDADHFDSFMKHMTRREFSLRGSVWEKAVWNPLGCLGLIIIGCTLAVMATAALGRLIGEDLAFFGSGIILVTSLLFVPFWRDERLKRAQRELLAEQRCFVCGYPLKGNACDDQGWSSCPECGRRFNRGEYERPDAGYARQFDDEVWIQHLEPCAAAEMRKRLAGNDDITSSVEYPTKPPH